MVDFYLHVLYHKNQANVGNMGLEVFFKMKQMPRKKQFIQKQGTFFVRGCQRGVQGQSTPKRIVFRFQDPFSEVGVFNAAQHGDV